jgi:hypothetical protein
MIDHGDFDCGPRRDRIDAGARAALTGLLASPLAMKSDKELVRMAYDQAEELEAERARRIK